VIIFGKVAELLAIFRAAKQLGLAPASVSAQITRVPSPHRCCARCASPSRR